MEPGQLREKSAVVPAATARRRWLRWRYILLALCVAVLLLYAGRRSILPSLARFLDVSGPGQNADYVMVLGGGSDTRPFVAAALVKAGRAGKVLVPRSKLSTEAEDNLVPAEQEIIRQVLVARGVAPQAIVLLPGECGSTADEARALAEFLGAGSEQTVLIVTTSYHTRRARRIFGGVFGKSAERLHFVAAPTDGFDESDWWSHELGWKAYSTEYAKLATSLLRN